MMNTPRLTPTPYTMTTHKPLPRLMAEAFTGLNEAYLYASTPSYQYEKMRIALETAKRQLSNTVPPIALPDADELYDTYRASLKTIETRSFQDAVILYAVMVAIPVCDIDPNQGLELIGMLNISDLVFGTYFKNTAVKKLLERV